MSKVYNLRCPVKDCSFFLTISEKAPKIELDMAANDLKIHLKQHTLDQLLQTIYAYAIHTLQHDIKEQNA